MIFVNKFLRELCVFAVNLFLYGWTLINRIFDISILL